VGYIEALTKEDIPIQPCAINRSNTRKCNVALCAIFRDEGDYLKEWLEYHYMLGVSHFYLYNNCSSDAYWEVLKPYVKKGIVELFDVPFDSYSYQDGAKTHNFVQVCCYNHAINLARNLNKWLAIIDTDEFICPVQDKNIPTVLSRYFGAGGLIVYWQIYGTSNIWDLAPGELLIEKLVFKEPNTGGHGLFKSIVKPQFAECLDPHLTTVHARSLVRPDHQAFSHTPGYSTLPVDIIRINHYTYRTRLFYETVKKPRRERWGDCPSPAEQDRRIDYANSEYDPVMEKFVLPLKKRLKK
jgi:hypothetical protein